MSDLQTIVQNIIDPCLDKDLISAKIATINDKHINLTYPYPATTNAQTACKQIQAEVAIQNLGDVEITTNIKIASRTVQGGVEPVVGVKNIIAVSSAKGGVGKSTIATNLALALSTEGAKTGLLDADIYGPSIPVLLGGEKASINDEDKLVPHNLHGIQALSMGHLVDASQAVAWRGPMVIKMLKQLLRESAWDNLDFLVIDLPPGTGDVQLTLAQSVPVTGAIIVTTPQSLAISDAKRGIDMFNKVSISVLGYVANMTSFVCPSCNQIHEIFGQDSDQKMETALGIKKLTSFPLDPEFSAADNQSPIVTTNPDSNLSLLFKQLASQVGVLLMEKNIDRSSAFPPVVGKT